MPKKHFLNFPQKAEFLTWANLTPALSNIECYAKHFIIIEDIFFNQHRFMLNLVSGLWSFDIGRCSVYLSILKKEQEVGTNCLYLAIFQDKHCLHT